jgi:uncharacterized protein (DUF2062 family)
MPPHERFVEYLRQLLHPDRNKWLGPFRHRLRERHLWDFHQDSVARGAAIGVFFGILTPVAQILMSAIGAVVLRGNILVAAAGTFVTNPLTFAFVYYAAYRIGAMLTGRADDNPAEIEAAAAVDVAVSTDAASQALEVESWHTTLISWLTTVGPPLLVGVAVLALTAAVSTYLLVHACYGIAATVRAGIAAHRRLRK